MLQDHLLYSLDVQSNNIQRSINTSAVQTDISLPVKLRTSLFDEFLNLSYTANLYMQYSDFRGSGEQDYYGNPVDITYEDGYYARNYHTIALSSQLTRGYESFSHVIGLSLSYNKSGVETKSGFYQNYEDASETIQEDYNFYDITDIEDELQIDFTQYLYDEKAQQILYHRLAQKISYSGDGDKLGELENELEYQITDYLSFYNNMFYNYDENLFSKIF